MRPPSRRIAAALVTWAVIVATGCAWGIALRSHGTFINSPPLTGRFVPRAGPWSSPVIILAVVAVLYLPGLLARFSWRGILILSFALAAIWAVALALVDGPSGLVLDLRSPLNFIHDVGMVGTPASFLRGFMANASTYTSHVRTHPPGMVLVLWALARMGLRGTGWAATLEIVAGAAAVPAALIAAREVAGESFARTAAPFLALTPIAISVATSADAFFAGVSAWAVALIVLSTGGTTRRPTSYAIAGGLLFGASLLLSYGLVLLAVVPLAVAIERRRVRPLVIAGTAALVPLLIVAASGFSWFAGLSAMNAAYAASIARRRPYVAFFLIDLAAMCVALGPAIAVALSRLRERATLLLPAAALFAIVLAALSGHSKGEVERTWLPFAPWILIACGSLKRDGRSDKVWIAVTVTFAVIVQSLVLSPW